MKIVLFTLEKFWIFTSSFFRTVHTTNKCGHKTHKKGFMKDGKHTTVMDMPLAKNGKPDYCLKCIGNMSIRCAWCGGSIIIGNPVTLYIPTDTYDVPDYAIHYKKDNSKAVVGCLGWDCADTGADRSGFWLPGNDGKGKVQKIPTEYERLTGISCIQTTKASDNREKGETNTAN